MLLFIRICIIAFTFLFPASNAFSYLVGGKTLGQGVIDPAIPSHVGCPTSSVCVVHSFNPETCEYITGPAAYGSYYWYGQVAIYECVNGYWSHKCSVKDGTPLHYSYNPVQLEGLTPYTGPPCGDVPCTDQFNAKVQECGGAQNIINWDSINCTGDCDECPNDPNKTSPGMCGCGVPDTDTDGDGIPDCIDDRNLGTPCEGQ